MIWTIVLVVVLLVILWLRKLMKQASIELRYAQKQNIANKSPLQMDDKLKAITLKKKKNLSSDEVIIKNRFGEDILVVKYTKWQEIQTHPDAHLWDRLDDKL